MRDHPLWQLTLARLREFSREPGAVFWVFVFPVLLAVALGIAFRTRPPERPRVAVVVDEHGAWAAQALRAGGEVEVTLVDAGEAAAVLRGGAVDLVVTVEPARALRLALDPSREGARAARLLVEDRLQRAAGRRDPLPVTDDTVVAAGGRYIDFLLPGLVGLNLMGSSMWGIGYAVVWDRKRRLLKRYVATPMRRGHYLLAYLLSRLVFMVAEVAALVAFGWLVFDVAVRGSLVAVAVLSLLGAAAFAGLALLIAARVQSVEAASGWMNFAMMPMYLLSGAFFAYTRFPEWAHPLLRALPLTALNDGLRLVINDGASLWGCAGELGVLAAWAAVSFAIALKIFRWG